MLLLFLLQVILEKSHTIMHVTAEGLGEFLNEDKTMDILYIYPLSYFLTYISVNELEN